MRLPDVEISTDPSRLDVVERSIAYSICFGVYLAGRQVAFGRVVTDRAVFGYFADIFVLPEFRGRGISKRLVAAMLEHPDVARLNAVQLRTRDAHGLYAQFGFAAVEHAGELMARYRPIVE